MPSTNQKRRQELVKDLELTKTYQRTHTPTGVHRRLPDPPDPEKTASPKQLKNLHPPKKKAP